MLYASVPCAQGSDYKECSLKQSKIKNCKIYLTSPWVINTDVSLDDVHITCDVPENKDACIDVQPGTKVRTDRIQVTGSSRSSGCLRTNNSTLLITSSTIQSCPKFAIKSVNQSDVRILYLTIANNNSPQLGVVDVEDSLLSLRLSILTGNQGPTMSVKDSTLNLTETIINSNKNSLTGTVNIHKSKCFIRTLTMKDNHGIYGGGIFAEKASMDIAISEFHRNVAVVNGGVIYAQGSKVDIAMCRFKSNRGTTGGAISVEGSSLLIDNSLIKSNVGNIGGAISSIQSEVYITNSVIQSNSASHGGGFWCKDGQLHVIQCVGEKNRAVTLGGGIKTTNSLLIIKRSAFQRNRAGDKGGAVWSNNSDITVESSEIRENSARIYGAGVFSVNTSHVFSTTNFHKNNAKSGGGMKLEQCKLNIVNSAFTSNRANSGSCLCLTDCQDEILSSKIYKNRGPAISLKHSSSTMKYNIISSNSGGIHKMLNSSLSVFSSEFTSNDGLDGGIIFATTSRIQMELSKISQNTAMQHGGAINCTDSELFLKYCGFYQNSAFHGGTIYAWRSKIESVSSNFLGNTAANGGGVMKIIESEVFIKSSTATNNVASVGGCIDSEDSTTKVENSDVNNNEATIQGGFFNGAKKTSVLHVIQSKVKNNRAQFGGAIFCDQCTITGLSAELNGNTAGDNGGVISSTNSDISFADTKFTGNSAYVGGVFNADKCSISIDSCEFVGNMAYTEGGAFNLNESKVRINSTNFQSNSSPGASNIKADNSFLDIQSSQISKDTILGFNTETELTN